MLLILIISCSRLFFHAEESPTVADWCCMIGVEFSLQILYNNFKTE